MPPSFHAACCCDHSQSYQGLSQTEIIGKRNYDIFPPAVAAAFHANDQSVLQAATATQWEEEALQEDGVRWHVTAVVRSISHSLINLGVGCRVSGVAKANENGCKWMCCYLAAPALLTLSVFCLTLDRLRSMT
ncbi:MAG TPA: PAS domain-containing protein [Candidatus Sericytochromatia bacterium]